MQKQSQVLLISCAGVMLASLDLFIVNVALPDIAKDLHETDLGRLSWVLNGYAIVYAALLVFFGRLADRYRRDRGYLLGVAIFTLASAGCALAPNVDALIGFRLVQAAGAALLTPTSLGLVLASFDAEKRSGAVRTWTAAGGIAAALGPVLGGLLVAVSWRWVFVVNVPLGIAAIVAGWLLLPHVPGHDVERPDPVGVGLATAGIGALTFGLVQGSSWGWTSGGILAALISAGVLITGFVLHCLKASHPLVHPSLFASRNFTGASLVAFFFSAAFAAMLFSLVLWTQGAWGWSALRTGLAIAPGPLMVPLVSFGVAGRLIARYGPAAVITLGSLIFGAGIAWWAIGVNETPNYLTGVLGGMLLTGIGVGLTMPTMMATASGSLPPRSFATGSAVINMVRQTAMALGVAVVIAILGSSSAAAGLSAFREVWWVTAFTAAFGIVPALTVLRRGRTAARAAVVAETPLVLTTALSEGSS